MFQAEGPASAKVTMSLLCSRKRRMELFIHGPASGVWCEESLEFLVGLRSYGCVLILWLNCCGNNLISACTQIIYIILSFQESENESLMLIQ